VTHGRQDAERRRLRRVAERAGRDLDGAPAAEIVRWAAHQTGGRLAVAASMQDAVLAHLTSQVVPGVDVLFLDTGFHFAETVAMRGRVARELAVNVVDVRPRRTVQEQADDHGPALHDRDPGLCCFLRKVEPLARALEPYAAWVSGVRRAEAPTRAATAVVAWDDAHDLMKVNPLAHWTSADVDAYVARHDLPQHPLVAQGFPSIGCQPCTRRVEPGADPRSGRWAGRDKVECGIHR
jgi:phosphoadenosine phosphosulfate reductase